MATGTKKEEKVDKKAEKAATVADLTARLKASSTAVLADYRGMTVGQMRDLRSKLRGGGIEMVVVKNTLARRAAKAAGYEPLSAELVGPIAMLFAHEDVSGPARILNDYIKANRKMVIKAGLLEGQIIKADAVTELADLPSREVLLSRLLGAMQAPLGNLASVLQAPITKFARTLDAVRNQKESQTPAPAAAAS
ncbi:MAG TPA: 50S ribosomal protein L10 [Candidatus Dormibacteraeota bacterium]|nr:50S ribosomal protein L10 [Candidatus Dormibacteraeota bacterium]